MFAIVILSKLEHIGTKLGADKPIAEADPIIREMMSGPTD